jgi:hypothetical protein
MLLTTTSREAFVPSQPGTTAETVELSIAEGSGKKKEPASHYLANDVRNSTSISAHTQAPHCQGHKQLPE